MNYNVFAGQVPQSPLQVNPQQDLQALRLAAIQQYLAAQPKYPGLPQMTPDMAEYYIMQNGGVGRPQPAPPDPGIYDRIMSYLSQQVGQVGAAIPTPAGLMAPYYDPNKGSNVKGQEEQLKELNATETKEYAPKPQWTGVPGEM